MIVTMSKVCTRCLLPETVPAISFDAIGVCSYCQKHKKVNYPGEDALVSLLHSRKNRRSRYDVIVTLSGGRESSYTLLKVAKDYKLKALAINFENPWTHPQAKANIEQATKALVVDLAKVTPDRGIFEGSFKNNLSAWLKNPNIAMLPMICIPCRTMDLDILRIARREKVRTIVSGSNPMQNTSFISELISVDSTTPFHRGILKAVPFVLKQSFQSPRYLNPRFLPITLKSYLTAAINALGPRNFGFDVSILALPYFVEWNEKEAEQRLKMEIGWVHPKGNTQRFDCPVARMKDYIYWKHFGVTKVNDYYAKMLRDGLISKTEAAKKIADSTRFDIDGIKNFLTQIGILEYEKIFASPL